MTRRANREINQLAWLACNQAFTCPSTIKIVEKGMENEGVINRKYKKYLLFGKYLSNKEVDNP
jgi:hypothetical protein